MGNVRSLPNKVDELTALTKLQREYGEVSMMCYIESWLMDLTPDFHVTVMEFHLVRVDRKVEETGKRKGVGDCDVCE